MIEIKSKDNEINYSGQKALFDAVEAKSVLHEIFPTDDHDDVIIRKALTSVIDACTPIDSVPFKVLEEIREEMEDTGASDQEVNGKTDCLTGINICLEIIDRRMAGCTCSKQTKENEK